jgi:hypothetical protein
VRKESERDMREREEKARKEKRGTEIDEGNIMKAAAAKLITN